MARAVSAVARAAALAAFCVPAAAATGIVDLQPFRVQTQAVVHRADGAQGLATLVDLHPGTGAWYLLTVGWPDASGGGAWHLQNAGLVAPLRIVATDARTISVIDARGTTCPLGAAAAGAGTPLTGAARSGLPYAPLCRGALQVRNAVAGERTSIERITDFLRDDVWGGERIVDFVKRRFYADAFLEQGGRAAAQPGGDGASAMAAPAEARTSDEAKARAILPEHLALDLEGASRGLRPGAWYAVADLPGVWGSAIEPGDLARSLLTGRERSVNPLDAVETKALAYLVAFDLSAFDVHFTLGTDHPRLDWSPRVPPSMLDPALPGPDGIAAATPLVRNGMVSPRDLPHTVATFSGGFKRAHGAFHRGPLAMRNRGSHYGFIEEGVVFSRLQPGLATLSVDDAGELSLGTWSAADDARLSRVRYARQNGLPLIEFDAVRGEGVPGEAVNLWGEGNWSGSADEDLRTLRAGVCLQEARGRRFLIYAWFSAATPSAMARTFQGYGCRYAMHLDMNALEHTYLALYVRRGGERVIEHLVEGMEAVDRGVRGERVGRSVGFPNDRDFFYVTRKAAR